ncbi:hypothetical protein [Nocardia camponoti]|uniref:Uncharacterized protein n=1 Tax=Nocardia camponoti TaxID=1616106 RepID=A0A917VAM2_9NOCA|nr:hypothetical protein [Nocardia camponoti]GGK56599.1 hypothetical protein GCM10011591_30840 [Nocardia camponoti]
MSQSWVPLFYDRARGAEIVMGVSAVAIIVGLWLPMLTGKDTFPRREVSFSVWDFRDAGTPLVSWLMIGALILLGVALLPDRYNALVVRTFALCVAFAEAIALPIVITFGYRDVPNGDVSITFTPWLLALILAVAAAFVGALMVFVADFTRAAARR